MYVIGKVSNKITDLAVLILILIFIQVGLEIMPFKDFTSVCENQSPAYWRKK